MSIVTRQHEIFRTAFWECSDEELKEINVDDLIKRIVWLRSLAIEQGYGSEENG